jgi:hypothetical protein
MAELAKLPSGSEFYAVLTVKNNCAEKSAKKQFFAPQTDTKCAGDAKLKLGDKYEELSQFIGSALYNKMTKEQQQWFLSAKDYFGVVLEDSTSYISGAKNSEVADKIGAFELGLYEQIKQTNGRDFPQELLALTGLYRFVMEKFLAIIQCQAESDLKRFTPLFDQYDAHLNPQSEMSFVVMKVVIDPNDELLKVLTDTLSYRPDKSASWVQIDAYRGYLQVQ